MLLHVWISHRLSFSRSSYRSLLKSPIKIVNVSLFMNDVAAYLIFVYALIQCREVCGLASQSILPNPTSWRSILILSSHLRLGLPSGLLPSGFPTKTQYTLLHCPIRATCSAHLILLDFITRAISGEVYRSLSSSFCSFLHYLVISSLLGLNIVFNILFSNTLSLPSTVWSYARHLTLSDATELVRMSWPKAWGLLVGLYGVMSIGELLPLFRRSFLYPSSRYERFW
jgi:hypothetical protein